jgi:excinuclease ABC subunit A
VSAIRNFTKGTENIPKKLSQQVQEEIDFYIVNTECPHCNAYGYIEMDRKLIPPDETLGSLVDKKLIRLHKHELKILDELALRNVRLLHPIFKLSTNQARNLRFFTNILTLDVPTLIIFDEPVAGMLPWEAKKMASLLQELRSMGHTILAIEHSLDFIQKSDAIITFGPGAGAHGGKIVFQGTPTEYAQCRYYPGMHDDLGFVHSRITHANTNRKRFHNARCSQRAKKHLKLYAKFHRWYDFVDLSLEIPLGKLVCVCGPSGSGKTAYIHAAFACCDKTSTGWQGRVNLANREGCDRLRRPYLITPEAIGKHPGSTPATYIGVWDRIRDLYAELPKAKKYRMNKSHFSFNTTVGRCPECLGNGFLTKNHIRYIECPVCKGLRMNPKVKKVKYKGYHIGQINGLTIEKAIEVFDKHSSILNYLKFLSETALEYLVIGQPSNSLSGGEALRIKIATKLCRRLGDRSLYILDNPFRGIGPNTVPRMFTSLRGLVDKNNTVLIAENIREVVCNCDWVIILDQPMVRGNKKRLNIIYKGLGSECPAEFWEHGAKRRNRS